MTEHVYHSRVVAPHRTPGVANASPPTVQVPSAWPVGAEVTVTWTEPDPEPSGRWVVEDDQPFWQDADGDNWTVWGLHEDELKRAEAALVDLIESDHLPPQMPSVDDIHEWMNRNGYGVGTFGVRVIRGTLDAIAALPAHARGPE